MIAYKDLLLLLWLAHSCAQTEPQLATTTTTTSTTTTEATTTTASTVLEAGATIEAAIIATVVTPVVKPSGEAETTATTTTTTTTTQQPPAATTSDTHNNGSETVETGENVAPISTAIETENQTSSQVVNQEINRDNNSCQCREHPIKAGSWYCCNIPNISMISSCSNISKWTNLHVRNLTASSLDLSNSIYRSLHSLAMTNGNISQLINSFPRHSKIRCLDFSNNDILEIERRAVKDVPHLEFFGISNNLLSRVPNRNQNKNVALDISGNMRMLCEPLNEIIYTDSFIFVNPERSFCLYNATHKWFNSTDLVSVKQLESIKKCGTKCPNIPNYGNCSCNIYNIMIIQNDQSKTVCNVDCSNLGLIELPPQLPDNTFTLNISNNRISSLGDHFHTNPTYCNIVKLDADNNRISSIYEFEGTKFIEHFQRLYMRNNSLSKIPEYFLNNALMDTDGRRIYLAENRLQCDCNSAKTLQNWLKERSTDIPDYMDIRCRNLPQSVIELQESKLCQSPPDWTDYIYYLIAAEVILLLALITKVSYDYWVFKTAGYLPWPASKMPKLPCDWLCES
ncbi:hypothetical protein ACLKA6_013983 [Drosophila palustris]